MTVNDPDGPSASHVSTGEAAGQSRHEPTMKTRKEKMEFAKARVGELYRWGRGQWRFNYWPDGPDRPGRESHPTDRATAMFERSQMLVAMANETDGSEFDGGSWRDYVRPDSEIKSGKEATR